MSDNIHRKLFSKLQQGQNDMPDYSPEEWLQLDNRLELAEKRKRRRLWLLAAVPFLLLLGINGLLGWKLWSHTHIQNTQSASNKTTVVFDTIYNNVTIHQYDTIYHTIYKNSFRNSLNPVVTFDQQLTAGGLHRMDDSNTSTGPDESKNPKDAGQGSITESDRSEAHLKYLERLPFLAISLLNYPQKPWYDLFREVPLKASTLRKVVFLRKGNISLGVGPVISWRDGLVGSNGKSIAFGNEVELGSDRLSWWQELSWSELRLKTERAIEGFPNPPSPDPNAKLDKTVFYRRDLGISTGLGYSFPLPKKFEAGLRLGIGFNYLLGGLHLLDYEDHDTDTHYEITEKVASGLDGWNGNAGLGLNWQATNNWQVYLVGNYYHYLGTGLDDWRIPMWASIRLGVSYRWR